MTGADPQIPPAYARRWKVELCCDLIVIDLCLSVYLSSVCLSVVRPATYISHLSLWSQNGSGTETTNKTILIASLHLSKSVIWCRILFMIGYLIIYTLLSKATLDGMFSLISFILLIYVVKARVCYLFEKHFWSNWLNEEWGNEDWGDGMCWKISKTFVAWHSMTHDPRDWWNDWLASIHCAYQESSTRPGRHYCLSY